MHVQNTPPVSPASGVVCGNTTIRPVREFRRALLDAQDRLGCLHEIAELVRAESASEAPDRMRRMASIHASVAHVADAVATAFEAAQFEEPEAAQSEANFIHSITGQLDILATALEFLDQYGGRSPRDETMMRAVLASLAHIHGLFHVILQGGRV